MLPIESLTTTVYVPSHNCENMLDELNDCPLLIEYVYGALPPNAVIVISPSHGCVFPQVVGSVVNVA